MKDTKTGLLIHTYKYAGSVPYTKALEMKSRKDKEYWGENTTFIFPWSAADSH